MSTASTRLRLFGAPAVFGPDGAPASALADPHRLALLALLALHPKRTVSRAELTSLLWPTRSGKDAKQALNQALFAISKALGDDAIFSSAKEVRLGANVAVDALEFRAALDAGRAADAMKLYSAPLLEGFEPDDAPAFRSWAATQRTRFATAAKTQKPVSDEPVEDLHDLSDVELPAAAPTPPPAPEPEPPTREEPKPKKAEKLAAPPDFALLEEPDVQAGLERSAEGPELSAKAPPPPDVLFDPAPAPAEPEPPVIPAPPAMPELMSNSMPSEPERAATVTPPVFDEPVLPPPEPTPPVEVRWVEPAPPPPPPQPPPPPSAAPLLVGNLAPPPATPTAPPRISAGAVPMRRSSTTQVAKESPRLRKLPSARLVVTLLVLAALGAAGYFAKDRITGATKEGIAVAKARAEAAQRAEDRKRSVAVLPIQYTGRNQADVALATKIVSEMTPMLARAGLIVAPGAALARQQSPADVRRIADSLNVAYVLEGVMQRETERVAFRFRLLDAASGTTRWEDTYRPKPADIAALQEDVAANVAKQVRPAKP